MTTTFSPAVWFTLGSLASTRSLLEISNSHSLAPLKKKGAVNMLEWGDGSQIVSKTEKQHLCQRLPHLVSKQSEALHPVAIMCQQINHKNPTEKPCFWLGRNWSRIVNSNRRKEICVVYFLMAQVCYICNLDIWKLLDYSVLTHTSKFIVKYSWKPNLPFILNIWRHFHSLSLWYNLYLLSRAFVSL